MPDVIFPGSAPTATLGATRLPSNVDLSIWQGDAQQFSVVLSNSSGPVDLTGTTPSAVIRASLDSPDEYAFTCTVSDPATGQISLYMPSALSKTIPAGSGVWNLQLANAAGDVRTYLAGDVTVYAEVDL